MNFCDLILSVKLMFRSCVKKHNVMFKFLYPITVVIHQKGQS